MDEHISFKFSPYKLLSFSNDLHSRVIHLIISRAAEKAANMSTLKIKSHNSKIWLLWMNLVQQQTAEIMTLNSIPRGALNSQLVPLSPNSYKVRPLFST